MGQLITRNIFNLTLLFFSVWCPWRSNAMCAGIEQQTSLPLNFTGVLPAQTDRERLLKCRCGAKWRSAGWTNDEVLQKVHEKRNILGHSIAVQTLMDNRTHVEAYCALHSVCVLLVVISCLSTALTIARWLYCDMLQAHTHTYMLYHLICYMILLHIPAVIGWAISRWQRVCVAV